MDRSGFPLTRSFHSLHPFPWPSLPPGQVVGHFTIRTPTINLS